MNPIEPSHRESGPASSESGVPDADRNWPLAISLLTVWRGAGDAQRRSAVAQRLAEIAVEGGPAAVEQTALGLTDVAGMFLEMYANRMKASPDAVLQLAAVLDDDLWR